MKNRLSNFEKAIKSNNITVDKEILTELIDPVESAQVDQTKYGNHIIMQFSIPEARGQ